jgi:hypothetical protein
MQLTNYSDNIVGIKFASSNKYYGFTLALYTRDRTSSIKTYSINKLIIQIVSLALLHLIERWNMALLHK